MSPRQIRSSNMPARFQGWSDGSEEFDHDTLVTLEWIGGPPSGTEWSNVNFILAETLREKFDSRKIVKLQFRAIPDTEDEYDIRCEILSKAPVRLHAVRHALKGVKQKKKGPSSEVIKFKVENVNGPSLSEGDEAVRKQFKSLPLSRRIYLWQRYLAPHFK